MAYHIILNFAFLPCATVLTLHLLYRGGNRGTQRNNLLRVSHPSFEEELKSCSADSVRVG